MIFNTTQLWIIIITAITISIILLFQFIKRGGTIKSKIGTIIIPEQVRNKTPESRDIFDYMMYKLAEIRRKEYKFFLKELKKTGIEENCLADHEDSRFYQQCLGNIVYSGNGIRSIKTIIEGELIRGNYLKNRRDSEYDQYIREITDQCMQSSERYLNDNYDSQMSFGKDMLFDRAISCEYLHEPEIYKIRYDNMMKDIACIYDHAIKINDRCKNKEII